MKTKPRITSILEANTLDTSITGLETFHLSELDLVNPLEFPIPTNIKLGHMVERIVSALITSATNYKVRHENIQIIEDKKTIGEIDFIIEKTNEKKQIHLELAYKFYLFDPTISDDPIKNWIGPNRNDSLGEKLGKLKRKQFPLLYHNCTKSTLDDIAINEVSQALCFLVSLFIPYASKTNFTPVFANAIKGYYLNLETFIELNNSEKTYYLPTKKEWGISPTENELWHDFKTVENQINTSITEKQAVLCWQKNKENYLTFFITWW